MKKITLFLDELKLFNNLEANSAKTYNYFLHFVWLHN